MSSTASPTFLGAAKCILRLSGRLVRDPFIVQVRIVGQIARRLFGFALECFGLAFDFISIHAALPSVVVSVTC